MVITSRLFGIKLTSIKGDTKGNIYTLCLTVEIGHDKVDMIYQTTDPKEICKLKIKAYRGDVLGFYAEGKMIEYIEYYL